MMRHWSLAFLASLLLGSVSVQAEPIVEYTFPTLAASPVANPAAYQPSFVAAGVDATAITRASASIGTFEISNPTPNYATQPVLRLGPIATSLSGALTANSYFSFEVTVAPGFELSLDSLTFDAARGGGSTPRGFGLFSSIDGFEIGDVLLTANLLTERPTFTNFTAALAGAPFQNLTGTTEFRFYVYSPSSGSTIEFDNIILNGTISAVTEIPEPASIITWMSVAGILCGSLVLRSRRQSQLAS
jgi:hypothetical protein